MQRAMLHVTPEQRDRINLLAQREGLTQKSLLDRLMDNYVQPKDPQAAPLATRALTHKPLLVYGKGATLRIDSQARPYIALPDGQQWQRLEFGKVVAPWE